MKVLKSYVICVVLVLVALVGYLTCGVVVKPDEYVLIKQFGAVKRTISEPGFYTKFPFIQSTQSIPKHKMCYDLPPSNVTTSDKKIMCVDSFVLYEITDPLKYVTTLGASQVAAEGRINNVVYNSTNTVIPSKTQEEIISSRDGALADELTAHIGNSLEAYGITLYKVETKMLDLPDDNKEVVFNRMISERNSIAASYTAKGTSEANKIRNDTEKTVQLKLSEAKAEAEKLRAEGEAEYMSILSAAYSDEDKANFYEFIRGMDTLKTTIKGNNKTLVLDADSEIARLLVGD